MASRSSSVFAVLACVVVTMALAQGAAAANHVLGGNLGWHVSRVEGLPTFYQDWADSNGPYELNDTLEFNYTPGDTIVRVGVAGIINCDASDNLGFFNTGHTLFALTQAGRIYFISGDPISCDVGLKFYVDVVA